MTPNQSHVAGLELALSKVDPWSDRAVWLRDLIDQAKSAPPSPDAELVELLRELSAIGKAREAGYADRLHGGVLNHKCAGALVRLLPRIDAKLASLKP